MINMWWKCIKCGLCNYFKNPPQSCVCGQPQPALYNTPEKPKREGWKAALEYVALNDEPAIIDAEALHGQPTVQLLGIVFGKTVEDVAEAVVRFRRKRLRTGMA